jgi:hypothetical protein
VSTVYRPGVTLLRQSRKKTDPQYNFFLQDPGQPVTLGMIYDPQNPDTSLMVSKQSGTLRALANPPAWHHANTPWGRTLCLDKTVSRPWVEWSEAAPAPGEGAILAKSIKAYGAQNKTESAPVSIVAGGPTFIVGIKRWFRVAAHYDMTILPAFLVSSVTPTDFGDLGGFTTLPLPPLSFYQKVLLNFLAHDVPPPDKQNKLQFYVAGRRIGEIPIDIVYGLKLRTDSNNDGAITADDDEAAMTAPGRVVNYNGDDDNTDKVPDRLEETTVDNEDDLVLVQVTSNFASSQRGWRIKFQMQSDGDLIKVWLSPNKGNGQRIFEGGTFVYGRDPIPTTIYVEGVNPGSAQIKVTLADAYDHDVLSSQVLFTVVQVKIDKPSVGALIPFQASGDYNSTGPVDFQAEILPSAMNQLPINWAFNLEYQTDGAGPFTDSRQANAASGETTQQTFRSMGGKLTTTASVQVGHNKCGGGLLAFITGTNPPVADVKQRLIELYSFMPAGGTTNLLEEIPAAESGYKQFAPAVKYSISANWPIENYANGYTPQGKYIGIMQAALTSMDIAWDWQHNLQAGASVFQWALGAAQREVTALRAAHPGLRDLTGVELENYALGLYNGAASRYYAPVQTAAGWQWQTTTNSSLLTYVATIRSAP